MQARRDIKLIDARDPSLARVPAAILHDCPSSLLERLEAEWAEARRRIAEANRGAIEHADWDWRNKKDEVEQGKSRLIAVECGDELQGVAALTRSPQPSRLGAGGMVYVDYIEVAPWNLKASADPPRYYGVGAALITEAAFVSAEANLAGRIGLHSLPQAEAFYLKLGMTRWGPDAAYENLVYFEMKDKAAKGLLESVRGTT